MFTSLEATCYSNRSEHVRSGQGVLAILALALTPSLLAQSSPAIRGTVVTQDGEPVASVGIFGSVWKDCCPQQREHVKTDDKGGFVLEHPSAVLHFYKENFEPHTTVVPTGAKELRVTLAAVTKELTPLPCARPGSHQKRIGWLKNGISFTLPTRDVVIEGGKFDVDYVRWVIRTKTGKSYLEIRFGPYALSSEPDDDLFLNSSEYTQRDISTSYGGPGGGDSRGHLKSGGFWRQTAVSGDGGAIYRDAQPGEAHLFDQIIDSICVDSASKP
jgi:hypothetical protein